MPLTKVQLVPKSVVLSSHKAADEAQPENDDITKPVDRFAAVVTDLIVVEDVDISSS